MFLRFAPLPPRPNWNGPHRGPISTAAVGHHTYGLSSFCLLLALGPNRAHSAVERPQGASDAARSAQHTAWAASTVDPRSWPGPDSPKTHPQSFQFIPPSSYSYSTLCHDIMRAVCVSVRTMVRTPSDTYSNRSITALLNPIHRKARTGRLLSPNGGRPRHGRRAQFGRRHGGQRRRQARGRADVRPAAVGRLRGLLRRR